MGLKRTVLGNPLTYMVSTARGRTIFEINIFQKHGNLSLIPDHISPERKVVCTLIFWSLFLQDQKRKSKNYLLLYIRVIANFSRKLIVMGSEDTQHGVLYWPLLSEPIFYLRKSVVYCTAEQIMKNS